jgi:flagellin
LPNPRAAASGSAPASLSAPLAQTRSRVNEPFATAVGGRQSGDIGALTGAAGNAGTAASLLQAADMGLGEISAALTKMKDLATQASTTTPTAKQPVVRSDAERAILNAEFEALRAEVDRIAGDTEFGGIKVLQGTQITFKVGTGAAGQDDIAVSLQAATAAGLASGLASDAITSVSGATQALTNVTSAIDALKDIRAKVDGASVPRRAAIPCETCAMALWTGRSRSRRRAAWPR